MRRIHKDRCGYEGYTCKGVSRLSGTLSGTEMTQDTDPSRVTGLAPEVGLAAALIDNYLNLPTLVRGMVMTVPDIQDMSGVPSVPELACPASSDPFGDGFLDLFSTFADRTLVGLAPDATNTALATKLQKFIKDDGTEGTMHPGVLEPMLDTSFSPVGVGPVPSVNSTIDGIMVVLTMLTKWRIKVEDFINSYQPSSSLWRINALSKALGKALGQSQCDNFRIALTSGSAVVESGGAAPRYSVGSGHVRVNGEDFSVSGLSGLSAPFTVYVNVTSSGAASMGDGGNGLGYASRSVTLSTSRSGDLSYEVGGVHAGSDSSRGARYTVYVITQAACEIDLTTLAVPREGIVGVTTDGKVYTYQLAPCPDSGAQPSPQ